MPIRQAPAKFPNKEPPKLLILLDVNCDAQLGRVASQCFLQVTPSVLYPSTATLDRRGIISPSAENRALAFTPESATRRAEPRGTPRTQGNAAEPR